MKTSQSVSAIFAALSKAQSEIKGSEKDAKNPFFKSEYSTLSSVWHACRDALTKNALAVAQTMESTEKGTILTTILGHSSGEWISSEILLNPVKSDPQGMGSAISYYRRYSLAAIVGIAPEDDDGNEASTFAKPSIVKKAAEPLPKGTTLVAPIEQHPMSPIGDIDEAVQPDPEEPPATWQETVCHVTKSSVFGNKLGEISDETLMRMYNNFKMPTPHTNADLYLKAGLVQWHKEYSDKLRQEEAV